MGVQPDNPVGNKLAAGRNVATLEREPLENP